MDRVLEVRKGKVWCERCLRVMDAVAVSQDPAPCGCQWGWDDEAGFLVARESKLEVDRTAVIEFLRQREADPREVLGEQEWICQWCGSYIPVYDRNVKHAQTCAECR
jgi:hypothetical protein